VVDFRTGAKPGCSHKPADRPGKDCELSLCLPRLDRPVENRPDLSQPHTLTKANIAIDISDGYSVERSEQSAMDVMAIGATFVASVATAFVVQRAVLGAMFRAFGRDKGTRR
jgi:hypothetical protein